MKNLGIKKSKMYFTSCVLLVSSLFVLFQNTESVDANTSLSNSHSGAVSVWNMNGLRSDDAGFLPGAGLGSGLRKWRLAASADMNGDRKPDLLWQNVTDGSVAYWLMDGNRKIGSGTLPYADANAGLAGWKLVAAADLNSDGQADLLWQYGPTGQVVYWIMKGLVSKASAGLPGAGPADGLVSWRLAAAADLSGDGKPELLFQNRESGAVIYWLMNGAQVIGSGGLPRAETGEGLKLYKLVSAVDVNGDRKADLLWQNSANGIVVYWILNRFQFIGSGTVPGSEASYHPNKLAVTADLTGDGKADFLWQDQPVEGARPAISAEDREKLLNALVLLKDFEEKARLAVSPAEKAQNADYARQIAQQIRDFKNSVAGENSVVSTIAGKTCEVSIRSCTRKAELNRTQKLIAVTGETQCEAKLDETYESCGGGDMTAAHYESGELKKSFARGTKCVITLDYCPNHPELAGIFQDHNAKANGDFGTCMKRSDEFKAACGYRLVGTVIGGSHSSVGYTEYSTVPVTGRASFYSRGILVGTKLSGESIRRVLVRN